MTIPDRFANLSPLKRALLAVEDLQARLDASEREKHEPVAIVGVGCRVPGGANPREFWALLRDGRSAVRDVPADRWDADTLYDADPDAPGKMTTRRGAFLDRIDTFDPEFFGIAPREAVTMDPQQRLLLEVCWEALEHAAIAPDGLSGSPTGVFVGIAASDYADLVKGGDATRIDAHFASGVAHSIASGRISYILGLQGPAVSVDTACSSSLVAVHLACQSLLARDCRMALAGGVNVIVTPDNGIVFSKSRMLAPDGECKTFDAAADGFGRGEGCGIVVLKRLSDARADGDRILAVIRGSAVNQDGPSSGLTAPNGPAQEAVIRAALARARVTPAEVDYVEAHGTGTSLGDPIEIQALGSVFASRDGQPLVVGSVKTNVGHLEAAAGVTSLIKIVLALDNDLLPAHLNFRSPNPLVAWEDLPIEIPVAARPWPRAERARVAGVSSFGFSGTNVHIVVADGPEEVRTAVPDTGRPQQIVTVSARSAAALNVRLDQLLERLDQFEGTVGLADVAHTANAGRAQFSHRVAVRARTDQELRHGLRQARRGETGPGIKLGALERVDPPRIAFMFTGQGAQYAGMARQLYDTEAKFRAVLDTCDEILRPHLSTPLLQVLYPSTGAAPDIDETAYTQPALFAVDYALAEVWRSWGIEPSVVMGHSLGEYVAACVAGVMSLEEALVLVAARGRLMQALPRDGAMASVFAGEARIARALEPYASRLSIAGINEPSQVVVSGDRLVLNEVLAQLAKDGITSKPLAVSHAFHSPLMRPMLADFEAAAARVRWSAPRIPVISNLTGAPLAACEIGPAYWSRHILSPVRFTQSVEKLYASGARILLESGPHPTLLGMAARCLPENSVELVPSLRKGQEDWTQMLDGLGRLFVCGARVDWQAFDRGSSRRKVALPTYPFERERYWVAHDTREPSRRAIADSATHPLLGPPVRAAVLKERVFESTLQDATHGWIFDHRVHGSVIVPGTGFVELAFAAAGAVWGEGSHAVTDLVIHAPVVLAAEAATTIQVAVSGADAEHTTVQVFSAADADVPWTLHAEACLVRADATPARPAQEALAAIESRCSSEVRPEDFYSALAGRGIDLGPAFRALVEIRRGDGEALARLALPAPCGDPRPYVVHPVMLDAAIQTLGVALAEEAQDSYVPVALARARVHQSGGAVAWGHARVVGRTDPGGVITADVALLDAGGTVLASIDGLRLQRVDRASLRRASGELVRDWVLQVEWEPQPLPEGTRGSTASLPAMADLSMRVDRHVGALFDDPGVAAYEHALPLMEELSAAYVAEAFAELGWVPEPGEHVDGDALCERLGIVQAQRRLVGRLLGILGETGALRQTAQGWVVDAAPRPVGTRRSLETLHERYGRILTAELGLLSACGPRLAGVLNGSIDPLSLLFPGGSSELAESLYQVSPVGRAFNRLIGDAIAEALSGLGASDSVRILEIGGGTGATTSFVVPGLPRDRTEYLFTDISPAFTTRARDKFAAYPFVSCLPLDIERDPSPQGLGGQQFDVIIAANVLHATRDLDETFAHVGRLLAPRGMLIMLEVLQPQRWIDLTFGLTDGWWRFTDRARRPAYPLLPRDTWLAFLAEQGFADVHALPAPGPRPVSEMQAVLIAGGERRASSRPSWIVLADEQGVGEALGRALAARGETAVTCTRADAPSGLELRAWLGSALDSGPCCGVVDLRPVEDDGATGSVEALERYEANLCGGVLEVVHTLAARPAAVPLTLVTRGAQPVAAHDHVSAAAATVWGLGRTVALEHPELACRRIDLDPGDTGSIDALAAELLATSAEPEVGFRGGERFVSRAAPMPARATTAGRGDEPYTVRIEKAGTFDGLRRVPSSRRSPRRGEVLIRVEATGLNFKDVMNVLGMYPGSPGPLGGECTGTVVEVGESVEGVRAGDRVLAIAPQAFSRYVTTAAALTVRVPDRFSFEDAATLGIPFVTAWIALHDEARIQPGERVLIHAAAGGVGLAAVQLALRAGAIVFATAGSAEKRAYLQSIGVPHVMSSRTLEFAEAIRQATGGEGVDVVLNSLAGDFIGAGFDVLAPGGRFIEIGKAGWTADRVRALNKRIAYSVVDWTGLALSKPEVIQRVLDAIVRDADAGSLVPLPRREFPIERVSDAFRFMAQAKHIGKIVVTHGDRSRRLTIHPDASYLITGGLSGLGLASAQWLARHGARSVILMGRHEPNGGAKETIAQLEHEGVRVAIVRGDVTREEDVSAIAARFGRDLPPLGGVIHSAGVLDDGVLAQQSWDRFRSVLAPKVFGTARLDRMCREQKADLFVMFSSVASFLGSPGQANHAAANAFMDALAYRRRAEGLPALSINWGAWAEIGAAVRHGVDRRINEQGIGTIDPEQGFEALEYLLGAGAVQAAVIPVDWRRYQARPAQARFLSRVLRAPDRPAERGTASTAPPLKQELDLVPADGREKVIVAHVREQARRILGLPASRPIDLRRPLNELGLDSLMAVELRNVLGVASGRTLPATLLFDYPSVEALSSFLARELGVVVAPAAAVGASSPPPVVDRIEDLTDEEVDRLLAEKTGRKTS